MQKNRRRKSHAWARLSSCHCTHVVSPSPAIHTTPLLLHNTRNQFGAQEYSTLRTVQTQCGATIYPRFIVNSLLEDLTGAAYYRYCLILLWRVYFYEYIAGLLVFCLMVFFSWDKHLLPDSSCCRYYSILRAPLIFYTTVKVKRRDQRLWDCPL